jgi:hypothetical protein
VRDIRIEGGTHVVVSHGDVGTNSNMEYGGSGSKLYLDTGYNMYYFDPINGRNGPRRRQRTRSERSSAR